MVQHTRRQFTQVAAVWWGTGAALGSVWIADQAQAQPTAYPNKGLTIIAPYPPGGGVDTVSRLIGEKLAARLNQAVVIDNKPGAGATLGATALARSAADGYTVMMGSVVDYAIAPHVHKNLAFDMRRDFVPVLEVGFGTVVLVVNADLPAKTVAELIALAKAKPGELSYASSGIGGLQHLNAEMFKQMAGVDLNHVPYKGTAQLLPDLIAGRVPTMTEAGVAGYESATNYTLFVPSKTPADVVALLNRETNAVLQLPEVVDKMAALGIVVTGGSTATATSRMGAEVDKWAAVIRKGNLSLN